MPSGEHTALINFANSTNFNTWNNKTGWQLSGAGDPCTFYGITCNSQSTHITKIQLPGNNLSGTLPSDVLTAFPQLTLFDLGENHLGGTLPSFSSAPSLLTFSISTVSGGNHIGGSIPSLVGAPNLQVLYLGGNVLTGSIPDLSNLTSLVLVQFGYNQLTGQVPPIPASLVISAYASNVCPNPLDLAPGPNDLNWDKATQVTPWWGPPGGGCDLIFSDGLGG